MTNFDVFNGDADGICALTQLRLAEPCEAVLITGVKRDIELLDRVQAGLGDQVTVLDVAMEKNRAELDRLLAAGAEVFYADHHFAGEIPISSNLTTLINEAPEVCTSLLVNGHLKGRFARWAVVGAFGDNLGRSARALASSLDLSENDLARLEDLGTYINYNGYGERIEDLHFAPDDLFRLVGRHADPLDFIHDSREHFERLQDGYYSDMVSAETIVPAQADSRSAIVILPNQAWARRVSGVYSNELTNRYPERAHAVLREKADGGYLVSVRAPLTNRTGAADLCRQFATGGGRAAAAGINHLPTSELTTFIDLFRITYS
ncbi:DHH family phosphoesterase [Pseudomonas citronellolis]|uniref:DHH family phosphoesterase n=1 Tax=Pseudomonas citronellolis TaxID=53408 RepID=UPI0021C0F726|nr:DHH family phosphoesterase [Pseudomonas citronellolis]UXJ50294.1 DHH family phosphoesterase [Pseudomonas citronellolis]